MKHSTSRTLHAYWDRVRGERAAPERAEIQPGAIRHILADSLILELDVPARAATVRLAGTRVCALYGRELRGLPFSRLWGAGAPEPWRLVETVALDTLGVVAGLRGANAAGETIDLELLLLPLRHRGRTQARALGVLSPAASPHWLGLRPLTRADTTSLRVLAGRGPEARKPRAPAGGQGPVRRGHLFVHLGGRA
jgi:hypothetical protein